jgi:2,4-diaminopentanoate dehydrogenase
MSRTRVALVGLGATGVAIADSLLHRSDCAVVGAADPDHELVGRDLGTLCGRPEIGVTVRAGLEGLPPADVAIVATGSRLDDVAETLVPLLERGMNVVSICEELAFPLLSHPELSRRLDEVARRNGVTLMGTGANPGVVMDTLPLLLSVLTQRVERVVIRRSADMSRYGAIVSKFGLGLTPREFERAQAAGEVIGHVGFDQAIAALASGLSWMLEEIVVDPVRPAFVTPVARHGEHRELAEGTVAAVTHAARGVHAGETVIDLEITFGFFVPEDEIAAGDHCRVEGAEQVVEVISPHGFQSHLSTVAAAVNVATAVSAASPGLRTMADLPVGAMASKGTLMRRSEEGAGAFA